jgi:glycerophosphoryl diester phosphodiesterase
MRTAVAAGVDVLELDVHRSADGVLVCCHDSRVDRTTNGTGRIADLTFAELERLDAAWWFVPGREVDHDAPARAYPARGRARLDPDYRIPSLEAVLAAFPDVPLNLDVKETAPDVPPYEEALVDLLSRAGRHGDVLVGSFHEDAMTRLREIDPTCPTVATPAETVRLWQAAHLSQAPVSSSGRPDGEGAPPGETLPGETYQTSLRAHVVAVQIPLRWGGLDLVTPESLRAAHDARVAVHVWTVNDRETATNLVRLGVDGIMSDRPRMLLEVLIATRRRDGFPGRAA